MKTWFCLFGIILFFSSCEYAYDYSYIVTNHTDSQINVHIKTFRIDSTFCIFKDSAKTLCVTDHGIEGAYGPYFADVTEDLDFFEISKNDSLISTRDYLKSDSWHFNNGIYSTTITNNDF